MHQFCLVAKTFFVCFNPRFGIMINRNEIRDWPFVLIEYILLQDFAEPLFSIMTYLGQCFDVAVLEAWNLVDR